MVKHGQNGAESGDKSGKKPKRSGAEKRRIRREKRTKNNSTIEEKKDALDPDFSFAVSDDDSHMMTSSRNTSTDSKSTGPSRPSSLTGPADDSREGDKGKTGGGNAEEGRSKSRKRKEARKNKKLREKASASMEEPASEANQESELQQDKDDDEPSAIQETIPVQEPDPVPGDAANALTDGDDFIPFNFDDSEDEVDPATGQKMAEEDTGEAEKPSVFSKVAEKLGKFVKESNDVSKRKRNGGEDHNSSYSRKRKREMVERDPYPWLQGVSYAQEREPARILHRELLDFVKFVGPTEEEHQVRRFVISRIQTLVKEKWPTASLHVFGSFETKLYLPTSDIDLVVLSSNGGETYEKPNHLRRLSNWLVKARIAENIQVIASARVPIIKFVDSVTKINVDISFNKPSGLVAASVVKRYTEEMPALRPLVVFIKHFLHMRGMNEVFLGGLGSYSITCMVISFLQRHPKISTGQILQEDNLGVLMVEFFELYGKRYNYDLVGININERGRYFSKIEYGWQRPGQTYLLSIQDPTDAENDIAKSSFGILKVKSTFGGGHDFLVQRLYDVNDRIKEKKRADVGLDSILSAVVSIDQEMKDSRKFIADCFHSDIVQAELSRLEDEDEDRDDLQDRPLPSSSSSDGRDVTRGGTVKAVNYVVDDEDEDDDLIDDDGRTFVRPAGYKKPSQPSDVDALYAKLNGPDPITTTATTSSTTTTTTTTTGAGSGTIESTPANPRQSQTSEETVYLIESSDEDLNRSSNVIDLDTDPEGEEEEEEGDRQETSTVAARGSKTAAGAEEEDSRVAQVDRSTRARYWDAKGREEGEASRRPSSSSTSPSAAD